MQAVLDQLRQIPEAITARGPRSVAELARLEAEANPVVRLQRRLEELTARADELNGWLSTEPAMSDPAARATMERELRRVHAEHTDAERLFADETVLRSYVGPSDGYRRARFVRAANVGHAALAEQPHWVVEYVHEVHDTGRLADVPFDQVASEITARASPRDGALETPSGTDNRLVQLHPASLTVLEFAQKPIQLVLHGHSDLS